MALIYIFFLWHWLNFEEIAMITAGVCFSLISVLLPLNRDERWASRLRIFILHFIHYRSFEEGFSWSLQLFRNLPFPLAPRGLEGWSHHDPSLPSPLSLLWFCCFCCSSSEDRASFLLRCRPLQLNRSSSQKRISMGCTSLPDCLVLFTVVIKLKPLLRSMIFVVSVYGLSWVSETQIVSHVSALSKILWPSLAKIHNNSAPNQCSFLELPLQILNLCVS